MSAHTLSRTSTIVRQTIVRYRWTIALSLLSMVTALAAYRFTSVPAIATPAVSGSQVSHVDPAQQGVLDYLRAHQTVAETRPLDPAQQSVMSYLQAHTAVAARPLDPAQQSVMDYLHVHSVVQPLSALPVFVDPTQQGVMSYLHAHHAVETRLDPAQQGVMDYLRAHTH